MQNELEKQVKEPILYVDDEEINIQLFQFNFRNLYTVYTALSAKEGMQIIREREIKVVVSDQRMPVKTGIEFLEDIAETYPNIIRILLTAYNDSVTLFDSINRGKVYKFVVKPYGKDDLDSVLKNAIEVYNLKKHNLELIESLKKNNEILELVNTELLAEIIKREEIEKSLIISEKKIWNIFNSSMDTLIVLNSEYKITNINNSFIELLKYSRDEAIGKSLTTFLHKDDISVFQKNVALFKTQDTLYAIELRFIAADKTKYFMEVNGKILDFEGEIMILLIARNVNERKEIQKKLLYAITETEEKERQHFAEELHDGLGPLLSSMKLNLHILKEHRNEEKAMQAMQNLYETVDEALINVKEISNQLSPYILKDFGLLTAIKSFINKTTLHDAVKINLIDHLNGPKLNDKYEVILYRVFTELINNTLKYAKASEIDISFSVDNGFLNAVYKDNGIGFDVDRLVKDGKTGHGISNIRNRLRSIGCEFNMRSSINKGFELNLKLELEENMRTLNKFE